MQDEQKLKPMHLAIAAGLAGVVLGRALLRRRNRYELDDKIALVTGGSRGLGLLLARALIRQGARVAICARDESELQEAKRDLEFRGGLGRVLTIPCDVRNREQVENMIAKIRRELGPLDVLINNAGIIDVAPVEEMTIEDFEDAMATHYWASVYTALAVLPEMKRRKQGRIVNITSIGGKVSVPHLIPYNASKFAQVGFSEGLRAELHKDGIRVTTICPGLMRTGGHFNARFKGQNEKEFAWFNLSGAWPISSLDAERAARIIIDKMKRGEAEAVLSIQANILDKFHALAPGLTADLLGVVNRGLPAPGGIGKEKRKGKESRGKVPEALTVLNDRAAYRHNEV